MGLPCDSPAAARAWLPPYGVRLPQALTEVEVVVANFEVAMPGRHAAVQCHELVRSDPVQ